MSLHTSHELTYLTCFDRYWLRSLWLLSTCLDMVPSDDRLNSKFSIVSFVASGGAIYNENKLVRSMNTYPDLLLLNQTVRFITRSPVWGCTTTHKHVPVTGVKILSTCEWSTNPSGSGYIPHLRRRGVMTWPDRDSAGSAQLSAGGATFARANCHICSCLMFSFVSLGCGRIWTSGEDHNSRNSCSPLGFFFLNRGGEESPLAVTDRGKMSLLPVQWSLGATLQL